jgi:hypothetical protein
MTKDKAKQASKVASSHDKLAAKAAKGQRVELTEEALEKVSAGCADGKHLTVD